MQNELVKIARLIDKKIANDAFISGILPEYLRSAVSYYPAFGGKRLRPAILIWCCNLLGGATEKALASAAAVEIWHNWTLVHDDIIDGDDMRRGRDATHKFIEKSAQVPTTGAVKMAILAGDLQQSWAADMILRDLSLAPELRVGICRHLYELGGAALISGEALDVDFSFGGEITVEAVKEMYELKTGALMRLAAEIGAMIALNESDWERDEIAGLGEAFALGGVAFQLRDDILGIFGEADKFGKQPGGDISEGKETLLWVESCSRAGESEKALLSSLKGCKRALTLEELELVRTVMTSSGALECVEQEIRSLTGRMEELIQVYPDNIYRRHLLQLGSFLSGREI